MYSFIADCGKMQGIYTQKGGSTGYSPLITLDQYATSNTRLQILAIVPTRAI